MRLVASTDKNVIDPLGAWAYKFDKPEEKQNLVEKMLKGQDLDVVVRMLDTPRRERAEDMLTQFFLETDKNSNVFKSVLDALNQYDKALPQDLYLFMRYMDVTHAPSEKAYIKKAEPAIESKSIETAPVSPKMIPDSITVREKNSVVFDSPSMPVDDDEQGIELANFSTKAQTPIHADNIVKFKKIELATLSAPKTEPESASLTLDFSDEIAPEVLETLGLSTDEISGEWQRKGDKSGGARPAGEYGGVYKTEQGRTVLIKADDKEEHNLAEFVGSYLNRAIVGDEGVQVIPVPLEGKTYLGSYFLNNFQDLFKYAYAAKNMKVPTERPRLCGSLLNKSGPVYKEVMTSAQGKGLETAFVSSLLLGDFDMHWGNLGAITDPSTGELQSIARIDFGWAFLSGELGKLKVGSSFGEKINPESFFKHMPVAGPTNHWRPVPHQVKSSLGMIKEAMRIADIDLSDAIEHSLKQAAKHWPENIWKTFAQRADLNIKDKNLSFEEFVSTVIDKMQCRIRNRQVSLRDLAVKQFNQNATYQGTSAWYAGEALSTENINTLFSSAYDREKIKQINTTA